VGLTARLAGRRAAVLVAEVPGWGRARCAVEQEVRRRGWRLAASPADADVLVVCGRPGARLAAAVDLVWDQLPGPRARVQVLDPAEAAPALDGAAAELSDEAAQRNDARSRPDEPAQGVLATDTTAGVEAAARPGAGADAEPPAWDDPHPGPDDDPSAHQDADQHADGDADGDGDGDDMDMDMDMDHGGMDMDMPMPGGIPLAGAGEDGQLPDPDQLDLDVLHVPLGPVLPHWPAGLLLHTTVQGELVVAAHAEVLEPAGAPPAGPALHGTPAGRWDAVATLLALAGWADAAAGAARLRDAALAGEVPADDAARLARRIRRSRLTRWSLRGVGALPEGDAADRLAHWLSGTDTDTDTALPITLEQVAGLVTGLDLATARLVVASLDLDTTDRVPVPVQTP